MIIFPILGFFSLLGLLYAEYVGSLRLRWIFKPLTSALFVLTALAALETSTLYTGLVILGLILGLAGDVLLIPAHREGWFLAGIVAFLLGHFAYVVAFGSVISPTSLSPVISAVILIIGMSVFVLLRPSLGEMQLPVAAYVVVISIMLITALAVAFESSETLDFRRLVGVGALCFYLSDLAVALDRFVKPHFKNAYWGLPLYYAAQFMIALSLAA